MRRLRGLLIILSLLLFGCKAAPFPTGRAASVRLLLDSSTAQSLRRTQVAEPAYAVTVTLDGADLPKGKYSAETFLSGNVLQAVSFQNVPIGKNRLVSLFFKNAEGNFIAGATLRAVFDLDGDAVVPVNCQTTPAGNVFQRLLASDPDLAGQLDCRELQAKIERIKSEQGVSNYALIDDLRLFNDALSRRSYGHLADITPPPVIQPAVLRVTLKGLPEGVGATLRVFDPFSPLQTDLRNGTYLVQPISPFSGTLGQSPRWLIQISAPGYGTYQKSDIAFSAGHTEQLDLDFNDNDVWKGWQGRAYIPNAVARGEMGYFIHRNKLYLVGGYNDYLMENLAYIDSFDPALNTWILHGDDEKTLMNPALRDCALAKDDSRVYVMGGVSSFPPDNTVSDNFKIYYPDGVWEPRDNGCLPQARGYAGAAFADASAAGSANAHNKIYLIGGITDGSVLLPFVDVYDCDLKCWDTTDSVPDLPTKRADLAVCILDDGIYAIGGAKDGAISQPVDTVERLSLKTLTWKTCAKLPTPRFGLATVVLCGKIYAIGGVRSNPFNPNYLERVNTVEVYDPVKDVWSPAPPLLFPRAHLAAGAINGTIVVVAGENGAPVLPSEVYTPGVAP